MHLYLSSVPYLIQFFVAGITLALFGGVRKHSLDQNKVPVRGDIHVIIVGILNFSPSSPKL